MNISCYVVDDEPYCVGETIDCTERTRGLELVGSATDPRKALHEIELLKPVIVFTDFNMPYLSGIDLAGKINHFTQVVFITGERQYNYPEIDWKNYMYLTKPLNYKKFMDAVSMIRSRR